jgi:PAS domain S-box-containing protein
LKGIDLIDKILAYQFHIPIIILTGYSDLGLAKKSLQLGIYDYLIKDEINSVILHKTIVFALKRSDFIHQIETEKENYENLFNFNPQPTWLLDSETLKILNANIAAQKKYGFYLEDFQNMVFTQLHPDEEEFLVVKNFKTKENRAINNYFTHYLSSGSEIKVDIYFKEFQYGLNSRLIVQSNDISERVNQLRIIEMQNSILRNIAWTQSNLLKAPISRVLEIINLMEEHPENFDKISYWLTELKKSTNEMDEVVKKVIEETNQNK